MTRSTLRKALDALEREGAIWRHVGKGTFVAADQPMVRTLGRRAGRARPAADARSA